MPDVYLSELRCHRCAADTPHRVRYAGRLIAATRCDVCGHVVAYAAWGRYVADLRHRATTKPGRMLRRLRQNPVSFVLALPGAIVSKPLRVLSEVATVVTHRKPEPGDPVRPGRRGSGRTGGS